MYFRQEKVALAACRHLSECKGLAVYLAEASKKSWWLGAHHSPGILLGRMFSFQDSHCLRGKLPGRRQATQPRRVTHLWKQIARELEAPSMALSTAKAFPYQAGGRLSMQGRNKLSPPPHFSGHL